MIERGESPVRRPTRIDPPTWCHGRVTLHNAWESSGSNSLTPRRDPWQTRPKTRVVLAASARTPVCFRAVRALTRGGVLTRAQSISRNYRICARFPRVGQRHPPCPSTGRGSDRPRQAAARTSSFDRVWRWLTSGEWRSCRSARDGGTPGESGARHGEGQAAARSNRVGSTGPFHSPFASCGAGHTVHKRKT